MSFFSGDQLLWNEPVNSNRIKEILDKIGSVTEDQYLRTRAQDLSGELSNFEKCEAFFFTLRSSPDKSQELVSWTSDLLQNWQNMGPLFERGLPGDVMWEPFGAVYDEIKKYSELEKNVALDLTASFIAFAGDSRLAQAREEHDKQSYWYIPFDPLRHAYDFFTVIWPVTASSDVRDLSLRALRAVGCLVNIDSFDRFCEDFETEVLRPMGSFQLLQHPGYEKASVSYLAIDGLLKTVTEGRLGLKGSVSKLAKLRTTMVSALVDVSRLLGLVGKDRAFFRFDMVCGLSVPPPSRGHSPSCRWYAVTWSALKKLHAASSNQNLVLSGTLPDDTLIWIDAKEDARHVLSNAEWSSLSVRATEMSLQHWNVRDIEKREHLLEDSQTIMTKTLIEERSSLCASLDVVEYEEGQDFKDGFFPFSVSVPDTGDYLSSLVKVMGALYMAKHPGFLTREILEGPLQSLFPLEHNFIGGLKKILSHAAHTPYVPDFTDNIYTVYREYYQEEKENLFYAAMRASAFLYCTENQFTALKERELTNAKDPTVQNLEFWLREQVYETEQNIPHAILQDLFVKYPKKLRALFGRQKVAALKKFDRLTNIALPRAYKFCHISVLDILLPVIEYHHID